MMTTSLIKQATDYLKAGKLVALPTETVYGLGADALNETALQRLLITKHRSKGKPISVLIEKPEDMHNWARDIPQAAEILAKHCWPGPLTIILKKAPQVSTILSGNTDTIGLRIPNHPLTLAILKSLGHGIAASSANRAGEKSPTDVASVKTALGDAVDLIIDGGSCEFGIGSTIIDLSGKSIRLLREGAMTVSTLEKLIGSIQ